MYLLFTLSPSVKAENDFSSLNFRVNIFLKSEIKLRYLSDEEESKNNLILFLSLKFRLFKIDLKLIECSVQLMLVIH